MLIYASGWILASQFRSYTPLPKRWLFHGQRDAIFGGEIVVFALKFGGNRAKIALFSGQKFVTPFSTLANNQRSLPTYSTMLDHS